MLLYRYILHLIWYVYIWSNGLYCHRMDDGIELAYFSQLDDNDKQQYKEKMTKLGLQMDPYLFSTDQCRQTDPFGLVWNIQIFVFI